MVQVLAKLVTSLLSAYRKDIVDMYYSNDSNRPHLDQSENRRICKVLFKTKTLARTIRWLCHDINPCFKPYRPRFKRSTLPDSAPQTCGIRIKTTSLSSAWTNTCCTYR